MGPRQEIACRVDSEPATYPAVAVPEVGERFSDEDLHVRFNVPTWGGIRVSLDKKCMVVVGPASRPCHEDVDHGRTVSYLGQNSDREGIQDQEMLVERIPPTQSTTEPAEPGRRKTQAGGRNFSLSISKAEGYTVLYFTRERGAGDLRFDSRVECDSHRFEVEQSAGRPARVVIKFRLRRVEGMPGTASGGAGSAAGTCGTPDTGTGAVTGGVAPRDGGGAEGAPPGMSDPVGHVAGIPGGARRAVGTPPHAQAPFEEMHCTDRHTAAPPPHEVQARPELDYDDVGVHMRDAIERGGYRAALHYYGSDGAKKSTTPWHRLRVRGWLLGRLGLYSQMQSWLDEASEWDDFDSVLATASSGRYAAYRPPALWLQTPTPMPRSEDRMVTFGAAAAACRDTGAVPDYIWAAMLILDAAGPICSRAGLAAAAFMVAAGAARREHRTTGGGHRYDPRRSARLHGAPEGCHRWIIADIDFNPLPANGSHYYYDLTDEGRRALADARAAGAPWRKATEAAASELGGMDLPDILENACRFSGPLRNLDTMRGDLGRLDDAWRAPDGRPTPPVSTEDQVLADLRLTAKWFDDGETAGSSLDYLLHLMTIIRSTHSVACEAEPSTGAESAVLQTLIAAIQDLCRKHGRTAAAIASQTTPRLSPAYGDSMGPGGDMRRRPPLYTDATPAAISDLYYCLAEYCRSRRLAVDPCSLPLYEVLTEDERAAVIKVLMDDSVFHHGED